MIGRLSPAPSCTLVIFGAAGDLTQRLLLPALYNLRRGTCWTMGFQSSGSHVPQRTTNLSQRACGQPASICGPGFHAASSKLAF